MKGNLKKKKKMKSGQNMWGSGMTLGYRGGRRMKVNTEKYLRLFKNRAKFGQKPSSSARAVMGSYDGKWGQLGGNGV